MDDTMFLSSSSSITNHSRACTSCARAKAKCTPGSHPEGKCERCSRLNKDCQQAPPPIRKRRVAKTPSRVGQLEEKLDDLVALLKNSQQGLFNNDLGQDPTSDPATDDSLRPDALANAHSGPRGGGIHTSDLPSADNSGSRTIETFTPASTPSATATMASSKSSGSEMSTQEAIKALGRFNKMTYDFPFILIAPEVTAERLRKERPLTFRSIMAITCRDPAQQALLGLDFRKDMCERVYIKGEKNIDILQGVLIHAAWSHYSHHGSPQLTNLVSLAMSIVFDLGLNKRPPADVRNGHISDEALRQGFYGTTTRVGPRTLEEQRAILGCYFISSVGSSYFQKLDPMRWTPYMDECVKNLGDAAEFRSDIKLPYVIKLQHITDRVRRSPWYESYEASEALMVPPAFFTKTLEEQLKEFRKSLPPDLENDSLILMQYHCVALSIYEIGLSKSPLLANYSSQDFQRLENLYACLSALQDWFDLFFAIPLSLYYGFSTTTCTQLAHALIVFAKITTFESPDWDLRRVREMINFKTTVDRVIVQFESVSEASDPDLPASHVKDLFGRMATKLRRGKAWFEARMAVENMVPNIAATAATPGVGIDEVMGGMDFDVDENFFQEILGDWAYNVDNYPVIL